MQVANIRVTPQARRRRMSRNEALLVWSGGWEPTDEPLSTWSRSCGFPGPSPRAACPHADGFDIPGYDPLRGELRQQASSTSSASISDHCQSRQGDWRDQAKCRNTQRIALLCFDRMACMTCCNCDDMQAVGFGLAGECSKGKVFACILCPQLRDCCAFARERRLGSQMML